MLTREQQFSLVTLVSLIAFPLAADFFWVHWGGEGHITYLLMFRVLTHQTRLTPAALVIVLGTARLFVAAVLGAAWWPLGVLWWALDGGPLPDVLNALGLSFPPLVATAVGGTGFLFAVQPLGNHPWATATLWFAPFGLLLWGLRIRLVPTLKNPYITRWAAGRDVNPLRLSVRDAGRALLLGMWWPRRGRGRLLATQPTHDAPEPGHLLICGPTRCGKGLHATTQLLAWEGSAVVSDIKGELFRLTAGYRQRELGSRIVVLDPSGHGHRYDPLADLLDLPNGFPEAAQLLMQPDGDKDPVFAQRAASGFQAAALAARHLPRPTWPFIRDAIAGGPQEFAAAVAAVQDPAVEFELVKFLGHRPPLTSEQLADRFFLSTWSTLTTRLSPYMTPEVLGMLSGADFRAADLVTHPTTLYLRFRESTLTSLAPLYRLVVLALFSTLMHQYDCSPTMSSHSLLVLLDEAGRTPIPRLPDLMSTTAGRGMSMVVYVQSLAQLEAAYGRAGATTILDNARSQVFYRPEDLATSEHIARRCGDTLVPSMAVTNIKGQTPTTTTTQISRPLIPAHTLRQVAADQVFVFVAGFPPVRASRIDWRLNARLRAVMTPPSALPRITPPVTVSTGTLPTRTARPEYQNNPSAYLDPDDLWRPT